MTDDLNNIYIEEANELLEEIEKSLIRLEDAADDSGCIEQIFRGLHTLKGNSAMFGFTIIAEFVHELEDVYDDVRTDGKPMSRDMAEVMFRSVDLLKDMILDPAMSDEKLREKYEEIRAVVNDLHVSLQNGDTETQTSFDHVLTVRYRITVSGDDSGSWKDHLQELVTVMSGLGQCLPWNFEGPAADDEQHADRAEFMLITPAVLEEVKNAFAVMPPVVKITIGVLDTNGKSVTGSNESNSTDSAGNDWLLHDSAVIREEKEVKEAETAEKDVREIKQHAGAAKKEKAVSSIRVSSDKLDELMNLVSELVTTQAGLSLFSENNRMPELEVISENVVKLSRRLRDVAFGMTLIPINNMFGRFQRLVRDLSIQLGKEVELSTEGGETELDKTIIEKLTDPLLHILRNSMDHGIEFREDRIAAGKPEKGSILLKAFYSGAFVNITIRDDGQGIDKERIRSKAVEKGLIKSDADLRDEEIFALIFHPGFSTASKVTDVSGRGVGMDVVKRNIESLKGTVRVDSVKGEGTVITVRLPLTLSIIDGLLVKVNHISYIIPLNAIVKCYEVPADLLNKQVNRLLHLEGEWVPFVNLREEFGYEAAKGITHVVVVHSSSGPVGISVDNIVGEYQAVIKPLGSYYKEQDFISGATILGDGTIALILDLQLVIHNHITKSESIWKQQSIQETVS